MMMMMKMMKMMARPTQKRMYKMMIQIISSWLC